MSDASGHTAAVAKPTRDQREVLRLSVAEKAAIKRFADVYGLAPSTYVRQAALGQLPPVPMSSIEEAKPEQVVAPRLVTSNVGVTPAGEIVKERVAAEVAEAKLEDDPARAAFIERRTLELYGQGKTTRLAESLAAEEWERRGA